MLADDIDGTLACGDQIEQCVFCVGEAAGDTDGEERRIVADEVSVGEGREVGRASYFVKSRKLEEMGQQTLKIIREDLSLRIPSSDLVLKNPIGLGTIPDINSL